MEIQESQNQFHARHVQNKRECQLKNKEKYSLDENYEKREISKVKPLWVIQIKLKKNYPLTNKTVMETTSFATENSDNWTDSL